MKKIFLFTILFLFSFTNVFADNSHFIDFNKVLNTSKAGSEAQKKLKTLIESESNKNKKKEQNIRKEETKIISEKNTISAEEYNKKIQALRAKVSDLQKNKQKAFANISKTRNKAKKNLLDAVNPIVKKYMEDNNIRIVLNKESVVLGDETLEITAQIIDILNKNVTSIKLD
jgi:outer membrane protein|tara:strand:+ start:268 stop:783 length:516 start_codon:yes stop_codon:yes gene_type:complete